MRKRDRLAKASGSLSPFRRYHGRSSSLTRLSEALAAVRFSHHGEGSDSGSSHSNKLLSPWRSRADNGETESETGTESIKEGLCPRNTAFGGRNGLSDEEEEDTDGGHSDGGRRLSGSSGRGYDESEDSERRRRIRLARRSQDNAEASSSAPSDEIGDEKRRSRKEPWDEEEDSLLHFDDATIDNTLFNAGCLDLHNAWQLNKESIGEGGWYPSDDDASWHRASAGGAESGTGTLVEESDEIAHSGGSRVESLDATVPASESNDLHDRLPNVILPLSRRPLAPEQHGSQWVSKTNGEECSLVASRPIFARNRCTITLTHGDYEAAVEKRNEKGGRGPKRWIVCSDGSEESSYAVEWTIGTVLRDGDETLVISVMETSEKLDPSHPSESASTQAAQRENQKIRQSMVLVLARQATALLQRTKLAVKISCQAVHAKHSRHMLLDLIDFFEPTMVIVGSRGLGSLKGILLGSTSHYLLQKSSRPIMIARKRLQLPALPRGKGDVVSSVRRRHMRLDEAAIEKKSKVGEQEDEEGDKDEDDNHTDGECEGHDSDGGPKDQASTRNDEAV